jgi:hypothetical protein
MSAEASVQFRTDYSLTNITSEYMAYDRDCIGRTIRNRGYLGLSNEWNAQSLNLSSKISGQIDIHGTHSNAQFINRKFESKLSNAQGKNAVEVGYSHEVYGLEMWGCAAPIESRLKREKKIIEDLQVDGDDISLETIHANFNRRFKTGNISLQLQKQDEIGQYQRNISGASLIGEFEFQNKFRAIVDIEGFKEQIRNEKYNNELVRLQISRPINSRFLFLSKGTIQKRGEKQKIYGWSANAEYDLNNHIKMNLISDRIIESNSPRLPENTLLYMFHYLYRNGDMYLNLGRTFFDKEDRRQSERFSWVTINKIFYNHYFETKLDFGTNLLALIKNSRSLRFSYRIGETESARKRSLVLLGSYEITEIWGKEGDKGTVQNLQISISGKS